MRASNVASVVLVVLVVLTCAFVGLATPAPSATTSAFTAGSAHPSATLRTAGMITAITPGATTGATTGSSADPVSARRVRKLTAKVVKRDGGQLFITGLIRPKKGPVRIQRAASCNRRKGTCDFEDFRTGTITKKGRYTVRVYAPRTGSLAWRAKKGKMASDVWVTCVKAPGESCPMP